MGTQRYFSFDADTLALLVFKTIVESFWMSFFYLKIGRFYVKYHIFQWSWKTERSGCTGAMVLPGPWSWVEQPSSADLPSSFPPSSPHPFLYIPPFKPVPPQLFIWCLGSWKHLCLKCLIYVVSLVARSWEDLGVSRDSSTAPSGMLYITRCQKPTKRRWDHQMRQIFLKWRQRPYFKAHSLKYLNNLLLNMASRWVRCQEGSCNGNYKMSLCSRARVSGSNPGYVFW